MGWTDFDHDDQATLVLSLVTDHGRAATGTKSYGSIGTFTTGTGKYAGISGSWTAVLHSPDFRTAAEGTYAQYGEIQGEVQTPRAGDRRWGWPG